MSKPSVMFARTRNSAAPSMLVKLALVLLFLASPLRAEPDRTGKGIAGGALLGAELAIFGEAIAGLETPWLYWAGAGLGAVGGGIGGYYVETSGAAKSSFYLLGGGMALSIPAMIVYLDATNEARRALPEVETGPNYDEEPLDELDELSTTRSAPFLRKHPTPGILAFEGAWNLHPPTLLFSNAYSPFEEVELGAPRSTRLMTPLLSGIF